MMRALLDDGEVVDLVEAFPNFRELRDEQLSKEGSDADVRKIVAAPTDLSPVTRIIAVHRMIKRLFHEPGEWLRAARADSVANELDEFSLQSQNLQCPTSNVQWRKRLDFPENAILPLSLR